MLNENIQEAVNKQINEEMYSAYLYLAMAAYFDGLGKKGFAAWMKAQAGEEMEHAMKFYHFLAEQEATIKLLEIKQPEISLSSNLEAFEAALEHEKFITGKIQELNELNKPENHEDFQKVIDWFIEEQEEEEESVGKVVSQLKEVGDYEDKLSALEEELGKRKFSWD